MTDTFEVLTVLGFLLFCGGIWWVSPPWALIIGGALLMAFGAYATRRGAGTSGGGDSN